MFLVSKPPGLRYSRVQKWQGALAAAASLRHTNAARGSRSCAHGEADDRTAILGFTLPEKISCLVFLWKRCQAERLTPAQLREKAREEGLAFRKGSEKGSEKALGAERSRDHGVDDGESKDGGKTKARERDDDDFSL
jgi:hypothetical protein